VLRRAKIVSTKEVTAKAIGGLTEVMDKQLPGILPKAS
jgi:hypothetical protein